MTLHDLAAQLGIPHRFTLTHPGVLTATEAACIRRVIHRNRKGAPK